MTGPADEVRRHLLLATFASVLLACAGAVALFVALSSGRPRVVYFVFAAVAFVVSWLGLVYAPRWYRRANTVTSAVSPEKGTIVLDLESDSDSTRLYAIVAGQRIALLTPSWDFKPLLGTPVPAELFIDPATSRLMSISTAGGDLWCVPPGSRLAGVVSNV